MRGRAAYMIVDRVALRRQCALEEGSQERIEGVHPIDMRAV